MSSNEEPFLMNPSLAVAAAPGVASLALEEQVIRLQALLEASRLVHSTIELDRVLFQAARIAVLELEMLGAAFSDPAVRFGEMPSDEDTVAWAACACFPLLTRGGSVLCEMRVRAPEGRTLTLYEIDFLEGLVLQTSIAAENALNHRRHLEYARLAQDLQAAHAIQQSLLPQAMPEIAGYSIAARSAPCYQVGGDYLDVVREPDGSYLFVVADVAGKGLASALVCMAFRSAFRALARQSLTLRELAARLSQQHWEEGVEARRRYVTAIFLRLDSESGELEFVNAGHNPGMLLASGGTEMTAETRLIHASGTPLGLLPGARYSTERAALSPGSHLLLYTDGLSEIFCGEEEFGIDRLAATFSAVANADADQALARLWESLDTFTGKTSQQDDMTAIALSRLRGDTEERA